MADCTRSCVVTAAQSDALASGGVAPVRATLFARCLRVASCAPEWIQRESGCDAERIHN